MRTPCGAVRARLRRALPAFAVLAGRRAALSRGLSRSSAGVWMSRSMADRKAASVLPDPVGAMTSAFSPRRIAAQARSWTDVGPSGKAETNQARVAGAKPFSAVPVTPAGPAGPGDSAGLAGPDAPDDPACPVDPGSPVGPSDSADPDDPACSASPGDPAGPDDSGGPPGSVLAGSAGSSPPAVRMLTSSPVFPIFSSRRPVPGSHPASALLPPPQPLTATTPDRPAEPAKAASASRHPKKKAEDRTPAMELRLLPRGSPNR